MTGVPSVWGGSPRTSLLIRDGGLKLEVLIGSRWLPVEAKALPEVFLALASRPSEERLASHISHLQSPDGSCQLCKLTGKVSAASGRKSLTAEDRARSAKPHSGTVLIRHIKTGLTGSALAAELRTQDAKAQAAKLRATGSLPVHSSCKRSLKDLI